MSQQNPRNLAISRNFDAWVSAFPARPGSYYTQHREASHSAQQEAWTPYDGVPSGPQPNLQLQGHRQRDSGRLDKPWRNTSLYESDELSPIRQPRQSRQPRHQSRERPRSAASSPPFKRSKLPESTREDWADQPDRIERSGRQDRQDRQKRGRDQDKREKALIYGTSDYISAEYLSENFPPIDRELYKAAHKNLWENPKAFLWDSKGIHAKSSFISQRGGKYRCNVVLGFQNSREKLDATGDGVDKVSYYTFRRAYG